MPDMPQYSRPFTVWALKIGDVVPPAGFMGAMLMPLDQAYSPFPVPDTFLQQFNPQPGGYFVVYASGYQTWMKAEDFEASYTAVAPPVEESPPIVES